MKNVNGNMDGKVINLHYTDICNYHCRFCYARFGVTPLALEDWKRIIGNIVCDVKVKRFNLAGGEPLAAPYVQGMIDHIHSLGVDCSIITNGSLLTPEFIRRNAGKVSMIGISVDGLSETQNLRLGRHDGARHTLSRADLAVKAAAIHECGMRFKINTVVNAVNCDEDFSGLIRELRPDRWKLLRMIAIEGSNDSGRDLLVSDDQFAAFTARHAALKPVVENTSDIVSAYIVVNPHGQLIDNSTGRYRVSKSLLHSRFSAEFPKIAFNFEAYAKRY